jgi:2-octaprenylphenol hydroxylase
VNDRFNIVVVGAGVTGLTIAALLAQSDCRDRFGLTIVDANKRAHHTPDDDVGLRVSAISSGSAALLDSIGAWSAASEARICAYDRMRVWDESSTPESSDALRFDAAEFGVPQLGFIVENTLLQDALLKVLDRETVELIFATPIESMQSHSGGHRLVLEDGRQIDADLVIGADGARSFVRNNVGIESEDYAYHQSAFVTHLRTEGSHRNTAWQRFLASGPLGMLPLADGRISVVWSTNEKQAQWAMSATDDELGTELGNVSDHVLGNLTVAGPRGVFPLHARHANDYVKAGIALIGDAAHAVHPLAGQGANLGLQDAATLADVVASAMASGEHAGDKPVLRRYERARKGPNAAMLHFMTGLNRLFATDSALLKELRTTGMWLFNRSGPIREHVVSVALGSKR